MAAEEYLASLGIDTKDADRALDQIITLVSSASEHFTSLSKDLARVDAALNKTAGRTKEVAAEQKALSTEVREGSAEWQKYAKKLGDAQEAYREFRRGQVTGEGGGIGASEFSDKELRQYLDTYEATNASIITAARQRFAQIDAIEAGQAKVSENRQQYAYRREISRLTALEAAERQYADARRELDNAGRQVRHAEGADDPERLIGALKRQAEAVSDVESAYFRLQKTRDSEASAAEAKIAEQDRLYNAYLDDQRRGIERNAALASQAADRAIADIRRQTAAQVAAYSAQFAAAGAKDRSQVSGAKASISNSDDRIAAVYDANQRDADIASRGKLAVVTDELTAAYRRLAVAERAVVAAQNSDDIFAEERAMRMLADATEEARRANSAYGVELERSAAASQRQLQATHDLVNNLPRLRYALYDVSNAIGITSGVTLAGIGASAAIAVAWQRDFAQVQRTSQATGSDLTQLKADFTDLAQTIPETYSSLTEIGALGGQLGVDPSQLASFTAAVAKFSSTTDVSVDTSATAFGRLDALLEGVGGQYNRLGSSILQVGVNSVATESDIISVSSQIAAAGSQAGLTADEVIGLSGAFASVGVPAESARGTALRFFSQINGALSGSNGKLGDFAQISGKTADQFRQDWNSDRSGAILDILAGVNQQGVGAETALNALGITAQRDLSNLLKLSQNGELVAESFKNASQGFADGTLVADQYGITSETVAAKLQLLQNNFEAFVATLAGATTGPLADAINLLNLILKSATDLANNPVNQWLTLFLVGFTALVAVLGLGAAVTLRVAGSVLAMRSAYIEASAQGVVLDGVATRLATKLGILNQQTLAAAASQRQLAASSASSAATIDTSATRTGSRLSAVLGTAGLIGLAVAGAAQFTSFASSLISNAQLAAAGLDDMDRAVTKLTADHAALTAQTASLGNTDFGINLNPFDVGINAQNYESASFLDTAGLGFAGATASLTQFRTELEAIQKSMLETFKSGNVQQAEADFTALTARLQELGFSQERINEFTQLYTSGVADMGGAQQVTADATAELNSQILENLQILQQDSDAQLAVGNSLYSLGEALYENGDAFGYYSAEGRSNTAALQGTINSMVQAFGSDTQSLANNLQALYTYILQNTSAPAGALAMLRNAIAATGAKPNGLGATLAITPLMDGYTNSANKAAAAAQKSAAAIKEQVVTLEDYANDLQGVVKRAFDIRFGGEMAFDDISSGWNKIAEAIRQTNEQIREYQADMQGLQADKATREYWLRVAENYGDALRAGELRAELADIDNQLAKKAEELAAAQQAQSKTTEGNSQAAIENRGELSDLVQTYQGYITQLASSGLNQDQLRAKTAQLKQEFINQALQMGYSREAVMKYAAGFDDLTVAINNVPRNITVTADANPAMQALNEFIAKARDTAQNSGINVPIGTSSDNSGAAQNLRDSINAYQAQLDALYAVTGGNSNVNTGRLEQAIRRLKGELGAMGFKSGGWTGNGSANEIAGVTHGKEFVLNQRGAQMLPRPMLEGMNQGRAPYLPAARSPREGSAARAGADYGRRTVELLTGILESSGIFLPSDALAGAVGGAQVNGAQRRRY